MHTHTHFDRQVDTHTRTHAFKTIHPYKHDVYNLSQTHTRSHTHSPPPAETVKPTNTRLFSQTNTINPEHTETRLKKTQQSLRGGVYIYIYKKRKTLISARRDEAPVSAAAPATTEKHQETTTQLNTPSLFNYCHIITAIYLHLPHSHQTNTRGGKRTHRDGGNTRRHTRTRLDHKRHPGWSCGFIPHVMIVKLAVWYLLAKKERWRTLAENNRTGLAVALKQLQLQTRPLHMNV